MPKAPTTNAIIVTFILHSFFNSLARSRYLSLFSHSFSFILWSAGTAKSTILQIFFFFFLLLLLLIIIRSDLLAEIRWSVCISNPYKSLCVSFSTTGAGLCIYHLLAWSNLNLHVALYSFCASLLHSLMMRLMVPSLSLHSLYLLCCCILSILALIWLALTALFCAAIRRDSVSFLKFPFLSHVQDSSCAMLSTSRLKRPWSCFSSHFCFLVFLILLSIVLSVLFLMTVISPPSYFLCSLRVVVLMCQRCLRCWQVLFFPLFLVHIVCPRLLDAI